MRYNCEPFWNSGVFDDIFENFFGANFGFVPVPISIQGKKSSTIRYPVSDVVEKENSVELQIELPGMKKEDIDLIIAPDGIEIKAEKKAESKVEQDGMFSHHFSSAKFYRKIPLPKNVDTNHAVAVYKDGLLKIAIPKTKKSEGKRIDIK